MVIDGSIVKSANDLGLIFLISRSDVLVLTKDEEETLQSLLTILQGGFRSLQRHGGSRDLWGDCQEGRERGGGQDDGGGDHDDHN